MSKFIHIDEVSHNDATRRQPITPVGIDDSSYSYMIATDQGTFDFLAKTAVVNDKPPSHVDGNPIMEPGAAIYNETTGLWQLYGAWANLAGTDKIRDKATNERLDSPDFVDFVNAALAYAFAPQGPGDYRLYLTIGVPSYMVTPTVVEKTKETIDRKLHGLHVVESVFGTFRFLIETVVVEDQPRGTLWYQCVKNGVLDTEKYQRYTEGEITYADLGGHTFDVRTVVPTKTLSNGVIVTVPAPIFTKSGSKVCGSLMIEKRIKEMGSFDPLAFTPQDYVKAIETGYLRGQIDVRNAVAAGTQQVIEIAMGHLEDTIGNGKAAGINTLFLIGGNAHMIAEHVQAKYGRRGPTDQERVTEVVLVNEPRFSNVKGFLERSRFLLSLVK